MSFFYYSPFPNSPKTFSSNNFQHVLTLLFLTLFLNHTNYLKKPQLFVLYPKIDNICYDNLNKNLIFSLGKVASKSENLSQNQKFFVNMQLINVYDNAYVRTKSPCFVNKGTMELKCYIKFKLSSNYSIFIEPGEYRFNKRDKIIIIYRDKRGEIKEINDINYNNVSYIDNADDYGSDDNLILNGNDRNKTSDHDNKIADDGQLFIDHQKLNEMFKYEVKVNKKHNKLLTELISYENKYYELILSSELQDKNFTELMLSLTKNYSLFIYFSCKHHYKNVFNCTLLPQQKQANLLTEQNYIISNIKFSKFSFFLNQKVLQISHKNFSYIQQFIDCRKFIDECRFCKVPAFPKEQTDNEIDLCFDVENPKVSVVIPSFNKQVFVIQLVRSIQKQTMKNLEIVVFDDGSSDLSYELFEDLAKFDNRIILRKNKKNMGVLYTKSIGALAAKGEYIQPMDSDDLICRADYLEKLYHLATRENLELIKVNFFEGNYSFFTPFVSTVKDSKVYDRRNEEDLKHINMISYDYEKKFFYYNGWLIWDNFIKSSLYKKTLNYLGKNVYEKYIVGVDDITITHFVRKFARRVKHINFSGILHLTYTSSVYTSENRKKYSEEIAENHLFWTELVYEHGKNDKYSLPSIIILLNAYKTTIFQQIKNNTKLRGRYDDLMGKLKNNKIIKEITLAKEVFDVLDDDSYINYLE